MLIFSVFADVVLPILVLVGVGFVLDRKFQLHLPSLVKLNFYGFVPAFIFVKVTTSELPGGAALRVAGFTLAMIAAMFVVSELVGRLRGMPSTEKRSMQLGTMFYNCGNYGLPLMLLAYPGLGAVMQIFVLLTMNLTTFSVGLLLASSAGGRVGWKIFAPVLRQVTLWAAVAGLSSRIFEIPVTDWAWMWVPLELASDALIGVALMTVGVQLSQTNPSGFFARLRWALVIRLIGGPLVAMALVPLFGFRGDEAAILILSAAVPTAVTISLLAHEFDSDHAYLSGMVFYSTVLSLVTVSGWVTILRVLF